MTEPAGKYSDIHGAIIQRCLKNDQKAQLEIYRLYHQAVYTSSLRILRDAMLAEDIMQETFLTAFSMLKTFKGDSSFGAWLKRIAVNKSVDELRKRRIVFESLDEGLGVADEAATNRMEDEKTEMAEVNRIKNAINRLPEGYRLVLSLYLLEGYDHEEIASILKISESTSRSQYTRAKQKLIEMLNDGKRS